MAWIESHQELARHPKTKRLARQLGISLPTAIGHLHCLWWWTLDYSDDGTLDQYNDIEIADGAMWEGDPRQFMAALQAAGFIDTSADYLYRIHDWDEYGGKLLAQRKASAQRQKDFRDRHRNGTNTGDSTPPNGSVTVTSQPRNLREESRGEKRRGQKSLKEATTSVVAAAKPPPATTGWIEKHELFSTVEDLYGRPAPSQWSSLAQSLRDLDHLNATPDDLRARTERYPKVMGHDGDGTPIILTLRAVIKHWHVCQPPSANSRGRSMGETPLHTPEEARAIRERLLAGEEVQ